MNWTVWLRTLSGGNKRQIRRLGGVLALVAVVVAGAADMFSTWWSGSGTPSVVAGRARVIDGDSLRIGRHEIRMVGIDAPEGRQTCSRAGRTYRCGDVARDALRRMAAGEIRCEVEERDQHERLLATCYAGTTNINRELVTQGTAVRFGNRYRTEEAEAQRAKRGVWAGEFERPGAWRRNNMR